MFIPKAAQTFTFLLGLLVLVAAEKHSIQAELESVPAIKNDYECLESSAVASLCEGRIQEMVELGGEVKKELQDKKETALTELDNMKRTILNEANIRNEEANKDFQDLKETCFRVLQNMTITLNEANSRNEETAQDFKGLKKEVLQESQTMKTTILNELRQATTRKTYRKYDFSTTQHKAIEACQRLGGRLALPTNNEEEQEVQRIIGFNPKKPWFPYWISGNDQQQEGKWVDSVTNKPLRYTNFRSGEPNDSNSGEDCIHKSTRFLGWNDCKCKTALYGYVCEFTNE